MIQALLTSIVATSVMTLFSYLWAFVTQTQTREPQLLNNLIHKIKKGMPLWWGWIIHYSIGWFFVILFFLVWQWVDPSLFNGIYLGFIAGVVGCLGWFGMFSYLGAPPSLYFRSFYFQLLIAHTLFGIAAFIVYSICFT